MKALFEKVELNVKDVVTTSVEQCGEKAPVFEGQCEVPGLDDI